MSIEPGAIVMRNGRYGYQARIVRGDYAAKQEFTVRDTGGAVSLHYNI